MVIEVNVQLTLERIAKGEIIVEAPDGSRMLVSDDLMGGNPDFFRFLEKVMNEN
jgi:hypothetical protein